MFAQNLPFPLFQLHEWCWDDPVPPPGKSNIPVNFEVNQLFISRSIVRTRTYNCLMTYGTQACVQCRIHNDINNDYCNTLHNGCGRMIVCGQWASVMERVECTISRLLIWKIYNSRSPQAAKIILLQALQSAAVHRISSTVGQSLCYVLVVQPLPSCSNTFSMCGIVETQLLVKLCRTFS